jgi:hypothetical protein
VPEEKREKLHHEAPLIKCFKEVIGNDQKFGIKREINIGNDNATCSDIEYISSDDEYLIIEAKSHESKDAYNTRHKIFGQLLKEHGKKSSDRNNHKSSLALGILIPKDKPSSGKSNTKKSGYDFYRDGYIDIPEDLFAKFGQLVKAKYVFACSMAERQIDVYTWAGFRKGDAPIHKIVENA